MRWVAGVVILGVMLRLGWWGWTERRVWVEGNRLRLKVTVTGDVNQNVSFWYFTYRNHSISCGKKVAGCQLMSQVTWGDELEVVGSVEAWVGNNGKEKLELVVEKLELVKGRGGVVGLVNGIRQVRQKLVGVYQRSLPEPHASLLSGMVLGRGEKMPTLFYNDLINTGTIHIIAASGFNVTLVARAVMALALLFWKRRQAVIVALAAIAAYVIMAGAGPAVVRAGIMGGLVFAAGALGRVYWPVYGLGLSVVTMLWLWPYLVVDVSFQLSVAATIGLIWFAPVIKGWLVRGARVVVGPELGVKRRVSQIPTIPIRIGEWLVTEGATTLAAFVATMPVIAVTFGRISWISPVVNLLVLWTVPPLMLLGGVIAVVGWWVPILAQLTALLAWPLLEFFVGVVEALGK